MTNPYGQQPGQNPQQGGYPQSGGFSQPYQGPDSGGFAQPYQGPNSGGFAQQAYPTGQGGGQNELATTRPGSATGAAVLGFVQAGITLITTILLVFGLASTSSGAGGGDLALAWIVTLAQAVGAGLLIYGGVQLLSGAGRTIFLAGAALELVICLYYLIRILSLDTNSELVGADQLKSSATVFPILFAVMPIIGLCLALTGGVTAWVRSRQR